MASLLLLLCLVQVDLSDLKAVQLHPGPIVSVEEGDTLNLTCVINSTDRIYGVVLGSKYLQHEVFYNYREENSCTRHYFRFWFTCDIERMTFNLTIPNITAEFNNVEFTCELLEMMEVEDKIKISVLVPVTDVEIDPSTNMTVVEGNKINITCMTSAVNPKAYVTWYLSRGLSDDVIQNSSAISTRYEYAKNALFITKSVLTYTSQSEDDGKYFYCRASNNGGKKKLASSKTLLNVLYGPPEKADWFDIPDTHVGVTIGHFLPDITCQPRCNPQCLIGWLSDDHSFTNGPKLNIGIIKSKQQAGRYYCYASNGYGAGNKSITLNVNYGPEETIDFNTNLTHLEVVENEHIETITCSADCFPICSFYWTQPDNAKVFSESLFIVNVSVKASGRYVCHASNDFGSANKSLFVTVEHGPQNTIHLDVESTTVAVVREILEPNVTCIAICIPLCDFRWTYGQNSSVNTSVLKLNEFATSLPETFTCYASNVHGTANISLKVIEEYPPANVSINQEHILTLMENETVPNISCHAKCNPLCSYKWQHGDRGKVGAVFMLGRATPNITGIYTCLASNKHGTGTLNLSLFVEYSRIRMKQKFVTCPNNETGTTITLICETESYPRDLKFLQWQHTINKQIIRYYKGYVSSNRSIWTMPFCGYQDTGTYICRTDHRTSTNESKLVKETEARVTVEDKPVISNYAVLRKTALMITIKFYAIPGPSKIDWLKDGAVLSLTDKRRQMRNLSEVNLTFYHKVVKVKGFLSQLIITHPESSDNGIYTLMVTNAKGIAKQDIEVSGLKFKFSKILYAVVPAGTVLILTLLIVFGFFYRTRRVRKRKRKVKERRGRLHRSKIESSVYERHGSFEVCSPDVYDEINDGREANSILQKWFSKKWRSLRLKKEEEAVEYVEPVSIEMGTYQSHGRHDVLEVKGAEGEDIESPVDCTDSVSYDDAVVVY